MKREFQKIPIASIFFTQFPYKHLIKLLYILASFTLITVGFSLKYYLKSSKYNLHLVSFILTQW